MNVNKGDLFQLGNHKLLCGDSSQKESYTILLGDEQADLLITDPPYGVNMEHKTKTILNKDTYSKIANDNISLQELGTILYNCFINCKQHLKQDASYYIFSPQGGDMELMMRMMRESGLKCRHQLIWVKDRPVFSMNRLDYDYQHEPILYGWMKKHNFYRRDGKQKSSILNFKQYRNIWHPTSKPPLLIANLIHNSTMKNDIVLDIFGGGGVSLICSEKLGRQCRTIEIDPHYCKQIIKRYEHLTNKKAVKLNE